MSRTGSSFENRICRTAAASVTALAAALWAMPAGAVRCGRELIAQAIIEIDVGPMDICRGTGPIEDVMSRFSYNRLPELVMFVPVFKHREAMRQKRSRTREGPEFRVDVHLEPRKRRHMQELPCRTAAFRVHLSPLTRLDRARSLDPRALTGPATPLAAAARPCAS